jgi:hypothetical protein
MPLYACAPTQIVQDKKAFAVRTLLTEIKEKRTKGAEEGKTGDEPSIGTVPMEIVAGPSVEFKV